MVRRIEAVREAVDMQEAIRWALGDKPALVLRAVLCDGQQFKDMRRFSARGEKHPKSSVARQFRWALGELAEYWDKVGWPP